MRLPLFEPRTPLVETGPRSIGAVQMLRISLTDRCNYRCVYCMPADGVPWLPKDDLLTFEEIGLIVRTAIEQHNIRRFKLTGGEPTVRRGLTDLVRQLRAIPGVEDLSLTTNGELLEGLARPLSEAGLDRVTISIDSLRPERFKQVTRTGDLSAVLRGLDASLGETDGDAQAHQVQVGGEDVGTVGRGVVRGVGKGRADLREKSEREGMAGVGTDQRGVRDAVAGAGPAGLALGEVAETQTGREVGARSMAPLARTGAADPTGRAGRGVEQVRREHPKAS